MAIDPGKTLCGVAIFYDRKLVLCTLMHSLIGQGVKAFHTARMATAPKAAVYTILETPQHYPRPGPDIDANDLISIAVTGAWLAGRFTATPPRLVSPGKWKGNLPKDVCQKRAEGLLEDSELAAIETGLVDWHPHLHHNAWDAVALGLYGVKRFKKFAGITHNG
ncbi:MAG: hypothetical protein E6Q97_00360 [Desulfurellales bacterium]|nr:MAG: hypothetical protein E6Q97_00360 [Desulfurellales bacterium]